MFRWSVYALMFSSLVLAGCPEVASRGVGENAENAAAETVLDIGDETEEEPSGAPLLENNTKSGSRAKKYRKKKKAAPKVRAGRDEKRAEQRKKKRRRLDEQRKLIMDELNGLEGEF